MRRTLMTGLFLLQAAANASADPWQQYLAGNVAATRPENVSPGLLLVGGGLRDVDALKWFAAKAGRGHIVILRASGDHTFGEEFMAAGATSARTFIFSSREDATRADMLEALAKADGIFLAGGDQANYIRFWRDTPVAEHINAHVRAGKPLGGTSAGLAVLGEYIYGAMDGGSLHPEAAMTDALGPAVTIEPALLNIPVMSGYFTDSHFKERFRLPRLFAFLIKAQRHGARLIGIGVDEDAAVAVEPDGTATLVSRSEGKYAWIVDGAPLRNLHHTAPLTTPDINVRAIAPGVRFNLKTRKFSGRTVAYSCKITGGTPSPGCRLGFQGVPVQE